MRYGFSRPIKIKAIDFKLSDSKWVAISIDHEQGGWPKLNGVRRQDLLQLHFADIGKPTEGFRLFEKSHANKILEFADKHWGKVNTCMIHCYAGISRSSAVAAALDKIYTGNDNYWFETDPYRPNMFVYTSILAQAFEHKLGIFSTE